MGELRGSQASDEPGEEPPARAGSSAPPVYFVHVMKTGGTTLLHRVIATAGADRVWPNSVGAEDRMQQVRLYSRPELLLRRPAERIRRHVLVAGHHPFAAVDALAQHLGAPVPSISVLRDPVERAISHAKQLRWRTGDAGCSVEEVLDNPGFVEPYLRDHQTKVFSATVDEFDELPTRAETDAAIAQHQAAVDAVLAAHPSDETPLLELAPLLADVLPARWTWKRVYRLIQPLPTVAPFLFPLDDGALDRALANLERVDVLGVLERYDAFVAGVQEAFGWDLAELPPQRVSEPVPIGRSLRARVEALVPHDLELYERARQLAR